MNVRKILCPLFRKGRWLYRLFDCRRYEPPEPPEAWAVEVCADSNLRPNPYCPKKVWRVFEAADVPDAVCALHVAPPPPVPKVPVALQYENLNKIISPFFCPDLLINHAEISDKDYLDFLDKFVEVGNVIRCFLYAKWQPQTDSLIYLPHLKGADGKFEIYQINNAWLDLVEKRLDAMIEREITPQVDVVNGGSYNHWDGHWLNPENNRENTHFWNGSPWHYYEYLDYPGEGEMYQNTKQYLDWFEDFMLLSLESLFPGKIIWGIHEAKAGSDWHNNIYLPKFQERGISRDRLLTNVDIDDIGSANWRFADFPEKFMREGVLRNYNLSIHGVYNAGRYDYLRTEKEDQDGNKFTIIPDGLSAVLSGDGKVFAGDESTAIELAKIMRWDWHFGVELNQWFWTCPLREMIDDDRYWSVARALRDGIIR